MVVYEWAKAKSNENLNITSGRLISQFIKRNCGTSFNYFSCFFDENHIMKYNIDVVITGVGRYLRF